VSYSELNQRQELLQLKNEELSMFCARARSLGFEWTLVYVAIIRDTMNRFADEELKMLVERRARWDRL
jgi:hypothetical protein